MTEDEQVVTAYVEWLTARQYSPSTIAISRNAARAILRGDTSRWLTATARRLLYLYPTGPTAAACEKLLTADVARKNDNKFHGRKTDKKLKAGAFIQHEWDVFVMDVSDPSATEPTYHVLALMCATGLRIGDVLRVTKEQLAYGHRTGSYVLRLKGDKPVQYLHSVAPQAWDNLRTGMTDTGAASVASYVAPRGDGSALPAHAAYQAVRRQLKACCERLGIEERVFLHRIRKTVANDLYSATHDLVAVRDALGHENTRTTEKYVNSYSPERVLAAHNARKKNKP